MPLLKHILYASYKSNVELYSTYTILPNLGITLSKADIIKDRNNMCIFAKLNLNKFIFN